MSEEIRPEEEVEAHGSLKTEDLKAEDVEAHGSLKTEDLKAEDLKAE